MERIKITKVKDVSAQVRGEFSEGNLHVLAHHLLFSQEAAPGSKPNEKWITYHIIAHCAFRPNPSGSTYAATIRIRCRDFTFIAFNFKNEQEARDVFDSIKNLTCKLSSIQKLYAFTYKGNKEEQNYNGWEFYDPKAELRRQGISDKGVDRGWRISRLNQDYVFSPTYPALLAVPSSISDNTLNYAGKFRSKIRIPALTYLHPVNNCSITRCAQPMAGLRNNRSVQDEKLVGACFSASAQIPDDKDSSTPQSKASPSSSQGDLTIYNTGGEFTDTERLEDKLVAETAEDTEPKPHVYGAQQHNLIVDARPTVNALAMQAIGLGSENMDNYKFASKAYLGIENIHVMRDSLAKVVDAIKDSDLNAFPPNREMLAKSGWLKHIHGILDGSALIARQVAIHHSHVLIHCSDGWDRTSQLSALSQLMLDPYYRTIDGFIVLIEKDWLAFGHMFQHRAGYLNSEKWFVTQNDGLVGTAIQPESNGRNDAIENAFAGAKRFFTKKTPSATDDVDSDGEIIQFEDSSSGRWTPGGGKGSGQDATKPKETSPVFHQFLDATYQLLRQHPTRFEFNERFLRRLFYQHYSCQYGTFLYNNEKTRVDADLKNKTRSVWDYFFAGRKGFTNPDYDGGEIDDNQRGHERLIFPHLDKIKWWYELFSRTDIEMNGPVNTVTAKYLGPDVGSITGGAGVITGMETANTAVGAGTTNTLPNGGLPAGGLAGLRDSISNLGIGLGRGSMGTKSPGKQPLDVEMQ